MKKMVIYIAILLLMAFMLIILTGCNNETKTTTYTSNGTKTETQSNTSSENKKKEEISMNDINFEEAAKKQMALPNSGDQIAIMNVKDYGTIKFKFFPEVAPKAVENFLTHAKNGYYNGLTFHRVINEFMIQGGDPDGNGRGGESIWGKGFGPELDYDLVPYRGSLCMAMSQLPNSIGSQFFITQANYAEKMGSYYKGSFPEGLMEQYKKYGGYLSLYMQYTVFGQAYEGMDVVDKIAKVKTDENDKPLENVIIENIEVTTY